MALSLFDALAIEPFESGAYAWDAARRRAFGNDAENLVATRDCVNRSKGARDVAEWSGLVGSGECAGLAATAQGLCFIAARTVTVKSTYSLSVDADEKRALAQAVEDCPPGGPGPSQPAGFQPDPAAAESTPLPQAGDGQDCHPDYEPCLPNLAGDALNCGDLASSQRPVTVLVPGVDPYRLDSDNDGTGCS